MSLRAWSRRTVAVAFVAAATACTFDLADVATDTPGGGDGGETFDAQQGSDTGPDPGDGGGGPDGNAADSQPSGDGGRGDAPSDVAVDTAADTGVDAGPVRVTSGLVVLYQYKEGAGAVLHDTSGIAPAADLTVAIPANTTWVADGLRFNTSTVATSVSPAPKVGAALTASSALTLEAWITTSVPTSMATSARIFDFGPPGATSLTIFDMAQVGANWGGSLRVAAGGAPTTITPAVPVTLTKTHYVLERDAVGAWTMYVNGAQAANGTLPGAFTVWDTATALLSMGNTNQGARPFVGTIHLGAIYSRALTAAEVAQNHTVGP